MNPTFSTTWSIACPLSTTLWLLARDPSSPAQSHRRNSPTIASNPPISPTRTRAAPALLARGANCIGSIRFDTPARRNSSRPSSQQPPAPSRSRPPPSCLDIDTSRSLPCSDPQTAAPPRRRYSRSHPYITVADHPEIVGRDLRHHGHRTGTFAFAAHGSPLGNKPRSSTCWILAPLPGARSPSPHPSSVARAEQHLYPRDPIHARCIAIRCNMAQIVLLEKTHADSLRTPASAPCSGLNRVTARHKFRPLHAALTLLLPRLAAEIAPTPASTIPRNTVDVIRPIHPTPAFPNANQTIPCIQPKTASAHFSSPTNNHQNE